MRASRFLRPCWVVLRRDWWGFDAGVCVRIYWLRRVFCALDAPTEARGVAVGAVVRTEG